MARSPAFLEADFGPLLLRRCIAACAGGSEGGYEAMKRAARGL